MKIKSSKRLPSILLCSMLIVTMALSMIGCHGSTDRNASSQTEESGQEQSVQEEQNTETQEEQSAGGQEAQSVGASDNVLGEGNTMFTFNVTDREGTETVFEIHTDKETVGDALLELGLIEGDEGDYGLYVKTVNGITADYDSDGVYWAFYVNGEYAQAGVDATAVTEGDTYSFKVE